MTGESDKSNILVVGAPRSGTTLVAGLLSSGTEASPMLPECTILTQIIEHYHRVLNFSDSQRFSAYAIDEDKLAEHYRLMIDSMLATVRSHFQAIEYRYLILKDPELTHFVDLIPRFFGASSRIVCVVRDPRAVIASAVQVERKKMEAAWDAIERQPSVHGVCDLLPQLLRERRISADYFLYYWNIQQSKLLMNGKIHIVRYERIVSRDEQEFLRLEDFLGFSISREGFGKVHFDWDRSDPTYVEGYGGAIKASESDFRKVLSDYQISHIESMSSGINAVYGWW